MQLGTLSGPAKYEVAKIPTNEQPIFSKMYPYPKGVSDFVNTEVKQLLAVYAPPVCACPRKNQNFFKKGSNTWDL